MLVLAHRKTGVTGARTDEIDHVMIAACISPAHASAGTYEAQCNTTQSELHNAPHTNGFGQ